MKEESITPTSVSFPYTNPADPAWIAAAVDSGFSGPSLSREDCLRIRDKTGMKLPRWLMKDPTRRINRGLYACPELELAATQKKA